MILLQFGFLPMTSAILLHRYRRNHGFESCSGLSFFQALISQLLKLRAYNCDDQSLSSYEEGS